MSFEITDKAIPFPADELREGDAVVDYDLDDAFIVTRIWDTRVGFRSLTLQRQP